MSAALSSPSPSIRVPFVDYPVDPSFLLAFANLVLRVMSLIFAFIVAIGPMGMIVLVLIAVGLFMRDIYSWTAGVQEHQVLITMQPRAGYA